MIFHENCLLADTSHEISYLIFYENWEMSSAAVVSKLNRVARGTLHFCKYHQQLTMHLRATIILHKFNFSKPSPKISSNRITVFYNSDQHFFSDTLTLWIQHHSLVPANIDV